MTDLSKPAYCPRCDRPFDDGPTVLDALRIHESYGDLERRVASLESTEKYADLERRIDLLETSVRGLGLHLDGLSALHHQTRSRVEALERQRRAVINALEDMEFNR